MYISVTKSKNNINFVGYNENGKKFKKQIKFKPKAYLESNNRNNDLKTLFGRGTHEIQFDSIKEYSNYIYKNKRLDIHGTIDPTYQFINSLPNNETSVTPKTWAIDIECVSHDGTFPYPDEANYEINTMAILDFKSGEYFLLSLRAYDKTKNKVNIDPDKIKFKQCSSEKELLQTFVKIMQAGFPDFLIGYFSDGFDFPYLIKRTIKVLGKDAAKKMSPFDNISTQKKVRIDKKTKKEETYYVNKIDGIVLLDFLELYRKYTFEPRESYKLDFIASAELGENKVDYEEYDNLFQLWENDPQKFMDYNAVDVQLIKQLDDKLKLISLNTLIARKAKCNFVDMMGTLKPWEAFLYNELMEIGLCLPPRKDYKKEDYPGAYVKDPIKGLYQHLLSFDFDSLYPLTMCQYNISPEMFIPNLSIDVNQEEVDSCFFDEDFKNPNPNHTLTASGNYFKKDKKGIVPIIIEKLFKERKVVKGKKIKLEQEFENNRDKNLIYEISQADNEQMAIKILLNSLYGAMANKYFIFYDIRFARSITLSAQLATKFTEKSVGDSKDLSKFKIKTIYGDTDSLYFDCSHIVNTLLSSNKIKDNNNSIADFLNDFANKKMQPVIKDSCERLADRMSANNYMNMSREVICNSAFWTGKKKYALSVIDNEGIRYKKPKLKVTGIETVRSSTPAVVKPLLRNIITKILNHEDISKYVKDCKKEYDSFTPEQMAFPRGANNFEKWFTKKGFKKGIPIGVRAAFVFNRYIDAKNLEQDFAKIQSGDKIKFLYIKEPNVLSQDVCGFVRKMPEDLKRYVDRKKMWDKSFMAIVISICEKINIEYEPPKQNMNNMF